MNLLVFFLSLLLGTIVVKTFVFPIVTGIQVWPALKLEPTHPRLAAAWLGACAPIVWLANLAWFLFTVWLTRTRGLQSHGFLWPVFIFLGWSGAMYPYTVFARDGKTENFERLELFLAGLWIVLMMASFFVVKPRA